MLRQPLTPAHHKILAACIFDVHAELLEFWQIAGLHEVSTAEGFLVGCCLCCRYAGISSSSYRVMKVVVRPWPAWQWKKSQPCFWGRLR